MRLILAALALCFSAAALAQSQARPVPPGSTTLEEVPPPPLVEPSPTLEPQVTVRKEADKTVAEYRVRGKLYMIKVTPLHGPPYILMDRKGDGTFSRLESTLDPGLRVPQWVLLEF
jgi:hypothetical protein